MTQAEVWIIDLNAARDALFAAEDAHKFLTASDEARARRIRDDDAAARLRAAYIGLRIALETSLGPGVRGVAFDRPNGGKPNLPGHACDFSLSHSGGLALIGVVTDGIIGVDLELPRTTSMPEARTSAIIAAGEALGEAAGDAEQSSGAEAWAGERLLRAWVRLEAFAKAHGLGIGRVLTQLGIIGSRSGGGDADKKIVQLAADLRPVMVCDVGVHDTAIACVAVSGEGLPLVIQRMPDRSSEVLKLVEQLRA